MALYIPHSIFHLARLLYIRPETFGPYYVHVRLHNVSEVYRISEILISFIGYSAMRINTGVYLLTGLSIFVYAPF